MHILNNDEIEYVSGGGATRTIVNAATITGGAQIGSYLAAARLGATFGSAAGPLGAIAGAMITTAVCYYWNSKHPSD
ncbi:hypothetical protein [Massilia sp. YMA4]|uniref:hypothetical protein n=1 Tax=Massilia sp. YMA4 TaxID=1593482 RepID=UPI001581DF84|nr:hypothetical protein [Massilia sp. YMA4]